MSLRNIRLVPQGSCFSVGMGFETAAASVLADDGRILYNLCLGNDGALDISATSYVKQEGKLLYTSLVIEPIRTNRVRIVRKGEDGD